MVSWMLFNKNKKYRKLKKCWVKLKCPVCNKIFNRIKRQTHLSKPKNRSTCCSRSCSASLSNNPSIDISDNILDIYYEEI